MKKTEETTEEISARLEQQSDDIRDLNRKLKNAGWGEVVKCTEQNINVVRGFLRDIKSS